VQASYNLPSVAFVRLYADGGPTMDQDHDIALCLSLITFAIIASS
jgi:hypothetical protein